MTQQRWAWLAITVAAMAGVVFTALQIVERIAVLTDPGAGLFCDLNAAVSCSTVLDAWQSSVVLGVPNAFIGAVMFAMFLATGLSGLLGTAPTRPYLLTVLGLVVFFAGFATWFMVQTAFVIGALCVWCVGIVTAVAVIGAAVSRLVGWTAAPTSRLAMLDRAGIAVIGWVGWWILVLGLVAAGLLS